MMMMRSRLCIRALRRLAVSPSLSKPLFQLRCNSSSTAPVGKKGPKAFNSLAIQREAQSAARQALLEGTETSILYPRIQQDNYITSFPEILSTCQSLGPGMAVKETTVTIRGRIKSRRDSSSRLIFYDLVQDGTQLQVVYNFKTVGGEENDFRSTALVLKVGDIVSVTGYPGKTTPGQISVFATSNLQLLAPCLHVPPPDIQNIEKRFQYRHVDLMVRPEASQTLRLRSNIIQYLREHFLEKQFVEVQTPVIGDHAGGAIAKPFITEATVYRNKKLALRIAPELWLKKLIIGGMERVFEIGTQFRNEGIDATHNPEFTTCEVYQAYANLDDLTAFTEELLCGLAERVAQLKENNYRHLPKLNRISFRAPFRKLEFIPALEEALREPLPDFNLHEESTLQLLVILAKHNIQAPSSPTLPRLLDKLASHFIEPQCLDPTFIMYHPECMSPLAKSTVRDGRRVSTRIELFIGGKELVNAYEEENSPTEQRRKFQDQLKWKNDEESAFIGDRHKGEDEKLADETFVAALEWGLPPTAGWGIGIDRLCMLFSGTDRIFDVLAFGGLRGVVGQGGVNGGMFYSQDVPADLVASGSGNNLGADTETSKESVENLVSQEEIVLENIVSEEAAERRVGANDDIIQEGLAKGEAAEKAGAKERIIKTEPFKVEIANEEVIEEVRAKGEATKEGLVNKDRGAGEDVGTVAIKEEKLQQGIPHESIIDKCEATQTEKIAADAPREIAKTDEPCMEVVQDQQGADLKNSIQQNIGKENESIQEFEIDGSQENSVEVDATEKRVLSHLEAVRQDDKEETLEKEEKE